MTAYNRPPKATRENILALITALTVIATVIFFVAPLRTLPADVSGLQKSVNSIDTKQAVQAENIKTLTEIVSDSKSLRRDVDRNTSEISNLKTRVDRVEAKP